MESEQHIYPCPVCRKPLDSEGRCWKCFNRPCEICARDTGSAFITTCLVCEYRRRLAQREGREVYEIDIPDWHPTRLNELLGLHHFAAHRRKQDDKATVKWAAVSAGVPKATGPRRVGLRITLAPKQRGGDVDAYWKSTLDALVAAGLLIDDNRQHVELEPVVYARGARKSTRITLLETQKEVSK